MLKGEDPAAAISDWLSQQPQEAFEDADFVDYAELARDALVLVESVAPPAMGNWRPMTDAEGRPLIEYKWEVPVPGLRSAVLVGVWDGLMTDAADGSAWLHEWKFEESLSDPDRWMYTEQLPIYQYAANRLGFPVVGAVVNQVRAVLPRKPQLTKSGTMARNKIICDWPTYLAALQEAGLDPADYDDMRVYYEEQAPPMKRAVPLYRPPNEIKRTMAESIWPAVYDLLGPKTRIYRTFGFLCPRCSYREPCIESLKGGDVDFLWRERFTNTTDQKGGH